MSGSAGPSGGTGGTSTDGFDLEGLGVSRIRVWSGEYVNAIELTDRNGIAHAFGNTATGALPGVITLLAGEYITGFEGFCGDYVDSITIVTNYQRGFPFGGSGGSTGYQYLPEAGQGITGLFGRTGDWIDAIGIYFSSQH